MDKDSVIKQKFKDILDKFKQGNLLDVETEEIVKDKERALEIAYEESGFSKALLEETKATKTKVGYVKLSTMLEENCQECINFIKASSTCKKVEGVVVKSGWCNLFNSFELNQTDLLKPQNPFIDEREEGDKDRIEKALENLLVKREFNKPDTYYTSSNIKSPVQENSGGKKKMNLKTLSELHNVPIKELYEELKIGREIEKGISANLDIVTDMVIENLIEKPNYYSSGISETNIITGNI